MLIQCGSDSVSYRFHDFTLVIFQVAHLISWPSILYNPGFPITGVLPALLRHRSVYSDVA
jgi:hypothetical protein